MIQPDIIPGLTRYFAKYIPKKVLSDIFKQPAVSRIPGYDNLKAEILSLPEDKVISEFDSFVISINEKFVSDRVKKSNDHILFVEYGNIDVASGVITYNDTHLQISVATPINDNNNDMIMEALKMSHCLELLHIILSDLKIENEQCGLTEYLKTPPKLTPLDPVLFFGHTGWAMTFIKRDTVLWTPESAK